MQEAPERTQLDISARLAAVEKQIRKGEGDLATALEERDRLKREVEAARLLARQAAGEARKKETVEQSAALQKRVNEVMLELATHIPRAIFALQDYDSLMEDILRNGKYKWATSGRPIEEITGGFDHEFGKRLRAAIHEAAPRTLWDFEVTRPGGKPKRPELAKDPTFAIQNVVTDIYGNAIINGPPIQLGWRPE